MFFSFILLVIFLTVVLGFSSFSKLIFYKEHTVTYNKDFIFGFFSLFLLSNLLNFFIPLKIVSLLVIIFGVLFFLFSFIKKKYEINFFTLILICIFFIFISHEQGITYDSQLYHLQTIQLSNNFKIIFGIGNLQPHYGMNSNWHTLMSLLYIKFLGVNLIFLGNIALFSFFLNETSHQLSIKNKSLPSLFLILSIIFIISYSLFHPYQNGTILNNLSSPETDSVSMVFFIFSVYLFLNFINDKKKKDLDLLLLCVYLTISTKISYIGIAILPIILILKGNFFNLRINLLILFSSFFWLARSFISTGCLIFPISSTCISSSWSMNLFEVENYKNIVQSFARDTPLRSKFTDFEHTLYSNDWFLPWFKEYFLETEFLLISFVMVIINILLILIIKLLNKNLRILFSLKNNNLLIFIFFILNLLVWIRAPEIRFGYGMIIGLVVFLGAILILNLNLNKKINLFRFSFIFLLLLMMLKNISNLSNFHNLSFQRNYDYSQFKLIYSSNGYDFYKPKDVFCNSFVGFCTYQGYKVNVKNINNYIFMSR